MQIQGPSLSHLAHMSHPTSCTDTIQMKKGQEFTSQASLPVYVGTMTMQEHWLQTINSYRTAHPNAFVLQIQFLYGKQVLHQHTAR